MANDFSGVDGTGALSAADGADAFSEAGVAGAFSAADDGDGSEAGGGIFPAG